MSIVGRMILAGLVSASLTGVQVAQAAAPGDSAGGDTRGRLFHASKCVLTLGFSGGCDKDQVDAKDSPSASKGSEPAPAVTRASDDGNTRGRLFHASKCVMSFGFSRGCDKDQADAPARAGARDEAAPAAPDTSTRGRLFHASKCVATLGFGGGCDKGDAR